MEMVATIEWLPPGGIFLFSENNASRCGWFWLQFSLVFYDFVPWIIKIPKKIRFWTMLWVMSNYLKNEYKPAAWLSKLHSFELVCRYFSCDFETTRFVLQILMTPLPWRAWDFVWLCAAVQENNHRQFQIAWHLGIGNFVQFPTLLRCFILF